MPDKIEGGPTGKTPRLQNNSQLSENEVRRVRAILQLIQTTEVKASAAEIAAAHGITEEILQHPEVQMLAATAFLDALRKGSAEPAEKISIVFKLPNDVVRSTDTHAAALDGIESLLVSGGTLVPIQNIQRLAGIENDELRQERFKAHAMRFVQRRAHSEQLGRFAETFFALPQGTFDQARQAMNENEALEIFKGKDGPFRSSKIRDLRNLQLPSSFYNRSDVLSAAREWALVGAESTDMSALNDLFNFMPALRSVRQDPAYRAALQNGIVGSFRSHLILSDAVSAMERCGMPRDEVNALWFQRVFFEELSRHIVTDESGKFETLIRSARGVSGFRPDPELLNEFDLEARIVRYAVELYTADKGESANRTLKLFKISLNTLRRVEYKQVAVEHFLSRLAQGDLKGAQTLRGAFDIRARLAKNPDVPKAALSGLISSIAKGSNFETIAGFVNDFNLHEPRIHDMIAGLRMIEEGKLPVGIKLHCLKPSSRLKDFLVKGGFSAHNADTTFNLAPLGSASAAIAMLKLVEEASGEKILNNPDDYSIQICSPGELDNEAAGILTASMYAGSDIFREFKLAALDTSHQKLTDKRIAIYGAGTQQNIFPYLIKKDGKAIELSAAPAAVKNRTDILWCYTEKDIANVNIVATLLLHADKGGFHQEIGVQFTRDFKELFEKYGLSGFFSARFIYGQKSEEIGGLTYEQAMHELQGVMDSERQRIADLVERITQVRAAGHDESDLQRQARSGFIPELQALLMHYAEEMRFQFSSTI